nr:hypothetical protein [Morchella crassipes]
MFLRPFFPFISQAHTDPPPTQGPLPLSWGPPPLHRGVPMRTLSSMMRGGARGGFASLDEVKGREWGGDAVGAPPPPPPLHPPPPFKKKMGSRGMQGGNGGRGGGDSVLVCLRQTRDASPPTEGTVKAVRQPPRLWIFFFSPCGRSRKNQNQKVSLLYIEWNLLGRQKGAAAFAARRPPPPAFFASPSFPLFI